MTTMIFTDMTTMIFAGFPNPKITSTLTPEVVETWRWQGFPNHSELESIKAAIECDEDFEIEQEDLALLRAGRSRYARLLNDLDA